MSEQRTSNPMTLVQSCRLEAATARAGSSIAGQNWREGMELLARKFDAAADEIERLMRELAIEKRAMKLAGEVGHSAMAERDRLLAALERIAKGPVSYQLIIVATDALMHRAPDTSTSVHETHMCTEDCRPADETKCCPECKGEGRVTTDTATCITCGGTGVATP